MNKRMKLWLFCLVVPAVFLCLGLTYTSWLDKPEMLQANGDDVVGVIYDPNGADTGPAFQWTSRNALLSSWLGSTAVTTLGTIATGTWNADFQADIVKDTDIDWGAGASQVDADDVPESATNFWAASDGLGGNDTVKDTMIDWGAGAGQVDLADVPGGTAGASTFNYAGATELIVPAAESADAALATLGSVHIRGDEDRISYHAGAGGEIAGEVTKSFLYYASARFDPGAWYDSDTEVFLFTVKSDMFPNGIIIDEWAVSCNVDPDVEMDLDLKYADAWIGLANSAVIDILDTANGVSSEDTDASINGGAAVAAGKVVYLSFGADPEGTATQLIFEMWFHSEED